MRRPTPRSASLTKSAERSRLGSRPGRDRRRPRYDAPTMTLTRPSTRALPVLDVVSSRPAEPAAPATASDPRVAEYRPEAPALPSFHVWTLGCQMNRSDSEEMAGRLLAAGCAE